MNIEKQVRQFVRAQFAARVVRQNGEFQSTVQKNSAKVLIKNPNRVMQVLSDRLGKPAVNGHTAVFKIAKRGTVALTTRGETSVLTLVNAH